MSLRILVREDMRESPAGNLVTDAMREYAGADIALHNSSGIRKDIPEGEVTYRDCYEIDAFGNTMVTGEYTGRQVREMLELSVNERYWILQVSGLSMSYDPAQPFGAKVREVLVGGTPLDPDARYRVVTNSYLGGEEGTYAVFQEGENVVDTNVPLRDAIAEYFRRHSPVDARVEGRITTVKP
jgi:2',3'-cyclic-nucleotide 2'-phosphodiesterase/3'-nucleotidase